jgi:predicted ATPase
MKGQRQVIVRNNRVQFKLQIQRNITILRGNSATEKTTLIGMIADHEALGGESGATVFVRCALYGSFWPQLEKRLRVRAEQHCFHR